MNHLATLPTICKMRDNSDKLSQTPSWPSPQLVKDMHAVMHASKRTFF